MSPWFLGDHESTDAVNPTQVIGLLWHAPVALDDRRSNGPPAFIVDEPTKNPPDGIRSRLDDASDH